MKKRIAALLLALALCIFGSVHAEGAEGAPDATAEAAALADGEYAPDAFSFSGGTGKVTIECSTVHIRDGVATAVIAFSSPNYTWVKVDGVEYDGLANEFSSQFEIPVRLNADTAITAQTVAMSEPHEVAYTIRVELAAAGTPEALPGLVYESSMELRYATGFSVDYYEGGYALIDIHEGGRYLLVPEGKEPPEGMAADIAVILFAGKYSEPDYELLLREGCDLAIESTMIYHSPKVKEMIELLGIPVLVERASYEPHPLGRTEWIRLFAALVGREAEAEAFMRAQEEAVAGLEDFENTEKSVAFFYIGSDGSAVVRAPSDYVPKMIEMAGGRYAFADLPEEEGAHSTVSITMEEFYAAAVDADYLVYNASIDEPLNSVDDLLAKSPLFAEFRAVREGNVFCTGKYLYQATDTVAETILDFHRMLTGRAGEMRFLYPLDR